jgi:hypothetical protein
VDIEDLKVFVAQWEKENPQGQRALLGKLG